MSSLACLGIFALLLAPWGVGSLMAAIGKVRGWNTRRTFWSASISYALLLIVIFVITYIVSSVARSDSLDIVTLVLFSALVIIGILSPLGILVLRWRYPAAFQKSTPTPVSNPQVAMEQKQPPVGSGKDVRAASKLAVPPVMDAARSGHIFVSYRRSDSADIAGRIYDRLIGKFGKEPVFKDVDSIPLGFDFKEYLDQKVGECDVLLAIIGDGWLNASDETGKKRLEDPADFVRIDIQSALKWNIPVIPLLVRGAHMPAEENLPSGLRKLVYRNGIPIRSDPDFHRDMDRLISALEKYIR